MMNESEIKLMEAKLKGEIAKEVNKQLNQPLTVKVKYHDPNMPKLEQAEFGNWIDCRVIEGGTVTRFLGEPNEFKTDLAWLTKKDENGKEIKYIKYLKGDFLMLKLGISLNQGKGYEVNLVPRSSTLKNFHVIQANCYGVGDDTFTGDNDIYHFPCFALGDGEIQLYDRVCQMRINKAMNKLNLVEVDTMDSEDRGGFGHSGVK